MNSDNDNCDLNLKILPNKTTFSDNINEWGPIILPDTKLPDVNIPKESLTFRNEACDLNLYSYENNKKEFASKNDVLKIIKALNDFDSDLDEDLDLPRIANKNIDTIFKNIKENNPGTITLLETYNMPYPIIKLLIKRIIKFSLNANKKEGQ